MLEQGAQIGRYRIECQLGQGGMGSVYRARDEELGRTVAIKMVAEAEGAPSGSDGHARLLREAKAAAALHHPNAVAIFDVGEHDGEPYIVMEHVEGDNLRSHLAGDETPWRQKLGWLIDVARALDAAHGKGLVHRDVKPDNIMLSSDGSVKVVDFGIARRDSKIDPNAATVTSGDEPDIATLTAKGAQVGTLHYMAPEQVRGSAVDGRTDQFAWGVCAYEILGGQSPWNASSGLGVAAAIVSDEPAPLDTLNPEIPGGVVHVIHRAMRKKPSERFASMADIVEALTGELDASAKGTAPTRAVEKRSAELRRYSAEEMRQVLDRALATPALTGYSRSEVVDAAREVGADDEALDEALDELEDDDGPSLQSQAAPWWNEARQAAGYKWLRHFLTFLVINGFFFFVFDNPHWQRWMFFGWGLGLAMQGVNVLMPKQKKRRERRERRRRGRGEAALAPAEVKKAARILVEATERRRLRVDDSAVTGEQEALAEAEAAASAKKARR